MTKFELQDELKKMCVPFQESDTIQTLRKLYFDKLKINKFIEAQTEKSNDKTEEVDEKLVFEQFHNGLLLANKAIQINAEDIRTLKLYIIGVLVISIGLTVTIFLILRKK
jgi:hypothetical protein